ncbi:MAG: hypothetical protein ACHQDC_02910 [Acidimicrobiales bacterium]
MDLALFEAVAEGCRSLVPRSIGDIHVRARTYGVKVWFGSTDPPKDHYEAQVVGAKHVPGATALAIEVGFHLEHREMEDNDDALDSLLRHESAWREALGDDAVAGPFIGRPEDWRRISETWVDPDLSDPDLALELALRLTDYITALEPVRVGSGSTLE